MFAETTTHLGVIRQGDVLIIPIKNPKHHTATKLPHLTLAKGEVTGHSHHISQGKAELYERNGILYLKVVSKIARLQHDEHHALDIPQGDWMIRIQREYEPVSPDKHQLNSNSNQSLQKSFVSADSQFTISHQKQSNQASFSEAEKPTQSSVELTNKNPSILADEIAILANQVDAEYWEKKVEEAERRKEYLERLQPKKTRIQEAETEIQEEIKPRRKRIKYVESSDEYEVLRLDLIPNYSTAERTQSQVSTRQQSLDSNDNNFIFEIKNNLNLESEPYRNWRSVAD